MDAIDNLIYATLLSPTNSGPIDSDYLNLPASFGTFVPANTANIMNVAAPNWGFSLAHKQTYCSFHDHTIIEQAITRHWYDVNGHGAGLASNFLYEWPSAGAFTRISDFTFSPGYHIIYSYLLENTRILQIFERVIEKYFQDDP